MQGLPNSAHRDLAQVEALYFRKMGLLRFKRPPAGMLRVGPLNLEANYNMGSFPFYHPHGSCQIKISPVLLLSSLYKEILEVTFPRICLGNRRRRG